MDTGYILLQHYWWAILALLAGILVFLLFVQGGQTFIFSLGKEKTERDLIVSTLGHKWELTFTTLVTFGGAFFASFPLFYSTSFGGAFYVWMAILFFFVIQSVAYEFRNKPANILGAKTYEWFLLLNGMFGSILLGCAVGTLFTGGEFIVQKANIANFMGEQSNVISQWQNPFRGLEAILDYRNIALGLAVFFLARVLAIHYFYNSLDNKIILQASKHPLLISSGAFLVTFLTFFISILFASGFRYDVITGTFSNIDYIYTLNLLEMPLIAILLLAGVGSVLWGIFIGITKSSSKAIWFSGAGTILTVMMLLLLAGYNNTAYYPSLSDAQSSLALANSSSSHFTLKAMSYASICIPFVIAYIWYAWKQMSGGVGKNTPNY
ncbi:MAG: cytochrome d ubiquinol oxidase subunit II [Bacteroidales bacterium]